MLVRFVQSSLILLLAVSALLLPEITLAGGTGLEKTVGSGLCRIAGAMQGTVGRGLATISILILGIGAFFGKVNWGLAVLVGVGIAGIFGAVAIIEDDIFGGTACIF